MRKPDKRKVVKLASILVLAFTFNLYGIAEDTIQQDVQKKKSEQTESEASKANTEVKNIPAVGTGMTTADKKIFAKNMKELQNQRRKISLEMYQLRVKLIKEKPDLLLLHRSIMDMHRRLAVEINSNQEMKEIILDAKKINDQIMELIKNNKKDSSPESKTVK